MIVLVALSIRTTLHRSPLFRHAGREGAYTRIFAIAALPVRFYRRRRRFVDLCTCVYIAIVHMYSKR